MMFTRFAPSPTGPLHLGHAFAAKVAWELGDRCFLRIEDLDQSRARPEWEAQIYDDLAWLGFAWPEPVMRQSQRSAAYSAALDRLWDMGVLYPCQCSRRDIRSAVEAPQEGAPLLGPDGLVYPGTCRGAGRTGPRPDGVLRLDMAGAIALASNLRFHEEDIENEKLYGFSSKHYITQIGDVVLSRNNMPAAYHLAVVVDDAAQGITHVSRGRDLFDATPIHVLLQRLLGYSTPIYHHHPLVRDTAGKRLAKRDDARAIATYRDDGLSPDQVLALACHGIR